MDKQETPANTTERLCPKCGLDLSAIQLHEHRCPQPMQEGVTPVLPPGRVLNTSATLRRK